MPIYEFECEECKERFEKLLSRSEAQEAQECPHCGTKRSRRLISAAVSRSATSSTGAACAPSG